MESISNVGGHRLVALQCGHLFGDSCIRKWIKSQKKCPNCNHKAIPSHIRYIYAKNVIVREAEENTQLKKQIAALKVELEKTKSNKARESIEREMLVMESEALKIKCKKYQDEIALLKQRLELRKTRPEKSVSIEKLPSPRQMYEKMVQDLPGDFFDSPLMSQHSQPSSAKIDSSETSIACGTLTLDQTVPIDSVIVERKLSNSTARNANKSSLLTLEQKKRIEENKQRALDKRRRHLSENMDKMQAGIQQKKLRLGIADATNVL